MPIFEFPFSLVWNVWTPAHRLSQFLEPINRSPLPAQQAGTGESLIQVSLQLFPIWVIDLIRLFKYTYPTVNNPDPSLGYKTPRVCQI